MGFQFFYDFNSPYSYLAATRIDTVLPEADVAWRPIAFWFVLQAKARRPWSLLSVEDREAGMRECEERAERYGLPELVWPPGWPDGSYTLASLRAALVAEDEGRLRAFSDAAFAQNFVRGHGLSDAGIVAAAAAAGLDGEAVLARAGSRELSERLRERTDAALGLGVGGVPTVVTPAGAIVWGDDRLEEAAFG